MGPYKAPGPDGFQAAFFQRYWSIVGRDMTETVLSILNGQGTPEALNHTFLTLTPKVEHRHYIMQFRPIGLCNVIYKVITKVTVERLKEILPRVIAPTQASFIPKHQITDNVIIM